MTLDPEPLRKALAKAVRSRRLYTGSDVTLDATTLDELLDAGADVIEATSGRVAKDPFAIRDPGEPSRWPLGSKVVVPEAARDVAPSFGLWAEASWRQLGEVVELGPPDGLPTVSGQAILQASRSRLPSSPERTPERTAADDNDSTLRTTIRALISNAFYWSRDAGGTMEDAIESATNGVLFRLGHPGSGLCDASLSNGWTCTRLPNHEGVHQ